MKTNFNYINKTILLTFFFVLCSVLFQLIGVNFIPNTYLTMFNIFSIFASYFVIAFLYYKITKKNIDYKKMIGKASINNVVIGLITGFLIFLSQQLLYFAFIPFNTTVGQNVQTLQSVPTIFMILIAVVIAPIVEELFFRGFFYEISDDNLNMYLYIINSAILFSLLHLQNLDSPAYAIFNLLAIFISGFILGFVYRKTKWIGSNIIAHATANGISILLIILFS